MKYSTDSGATMIVDEGDPRFDTLRANLDAAPHWHAEAPPVPKTVESPAGDATEAPDTLPVEQTAKIPAPPVRRKPGPKPKPRV